MLLRPARVHSRPNEAAALKYTAETDLPSSQSTNGCGRSCRNHSGARRDNDAAVAVVEEDVCAVGLGEAWRALKEFFCFHDARQISSEES